MFGLAICLCQIIIHIKVNPELLNASRHAFSLSDSPQREDTSATFAPDFGSRRMTRDVEIMKLSQEDLRRSWETCVENAVKAKMALEDEVSKATGQNVGHYIPSLVCVQTHFFGY